MPVNPIVSIATTLNIRQLEQYVNDAAFVAAKGSAAANGDIYYNTTDAVIRLYSGSAWYSFSPATSVTTQTNTNYTILTTDRIVLLSTGGSNRTITLPAASAQTGLRLHIKKIDSGVGQAVVTRAGSDTIDGLTSIKLGTQYDSIELVSDGTNWHIVELNVLIGARYDVSASSANISIANGATEIIDFDTVTYDPQGAVTVGAAWKYTVQVPGTYRISNYCQLTSVADGNTVLTEVYKNGSSNSTTGRSYQSAGGGGNPGPSGSVCLKLVAADYIDIRITNGDSSSRNLSTTAGNNWVCIERIGN